MGHTPQPRFERKRKRWYFTLRGKKYARVRREDIFALYLELIGSEATDKPVRIAELVKKWLTVHPGEWFVYLLTDWAEFEGATGLADLRRNSLAKYRDHLRAKGNSPKTILHKVSHAVRVLRWALESEHIEHLPTIPRLDRVRRRAKDIPLQTLKTILEDLDTARTQRVYRILRFMLATGCRPKEARTARWEDIDLKRRAWRIRRTKTDFDRTIPLLDDAIAVLAEAKRADQPLGIVFRNRDGKPFTRTGLTSVAYRHGFSVYQLRHTVAQYMADTGVDTHIIASMLGHRSLTTTQHYIHVSQKRLREASASLTLPLSDPSLARQTPEKKTDETSSRKAPARKSRKRVSATRRAKSS